MGAVNADADQETGRPDVSEERERIAQEVRKREMLKILESRNKEVRADRVSSSKRRKVDKMLELERRLAEKMSQGI